MRGELEDSCKEDFALGDVIFLRFEGSARPDSVEVFAVGRTRSVAVAVLLTVAGVSSLAIGGGISSGISSGTSSGTSSGA